MMILLRLKLFLIVFGVFSLFAPVYAQVYAPIATRNGRPYSLLFLRFEPQSPLPPIGTRNFSVEFMAANSLTIINQANITILKEDIEADILRFDYSWRAKNGIQYSASLPVENLGGGFLDPIIEYYHREFLRLHNDRTTIPYGGHIVFSPSGGPDTGGFGIGDLTLQATIDPLPKAQIALGLKLPTGNRNNLIGSGRPDAGISFEQFVPIAREFTITIQSAAIIQSAATHLTGTRPLAWQLSGALTWSPHPRDAWIIQWQRESSALNSGVPLSDQIHGSLTVGYQRLLSTKSSFQAYFSEDLDLLNPNFPTGDQVGPDFTIGAKIDWQI